MSAATRSRSLALVAALALGLFGSTLGPSCLIPDYCIEFQTPGTNWCTRVDGAQMWPAGQPDLAEPVVSGVGGQPEGCVCMNDGEDAILLDELPPDQYEALAAEIEATTREICVSLVIPGYEHNCLAIESVGFIDPPVLQKSFQLGESRACIGSCSYAGAPPFGSCGPDPDPWECNGEDPPGDTGGGETGGDETSGGTSGFDPGAVVDEVLGP